VTVRILFLDDDPVVRVLRQILCDAIDPSIAEYFAPEKVDLSTLAAAAKGLCRADGAKISTAADANCEDADTSS